MTFQISPLAFQYTFPLSTLLRRSSAFPHFATTPNGCLSVTGLMYCLKPSNKTVPYVTFISCLQCSFIYLRHSSNMLNVTWSLYLLFQSIFCRCAKLLARTRRSLGNSCFFITLLFQPEVILFRYT